MLEVKNKLDLKLTSPERAKKKYVTKTRSGFVYIYGEYKALDDNKGRN